MTVYNLIGHYLKLTRLVNFNVCVVSPIVLCLFVNCFTICVVLIVPFPHRFYFSHPCLSLGLSDCVWDRRVCISPTNQRHLVPETWLSVDAYQTVQF